MKKIIALLFLCQLFILSCTSPKEDVPAIIQLGKVSSELKNKIVPLLKEQGETSDIDRMFALDSIIASEIKLASDSLNVVFKTIQNKAIAFEQTANLDRILIKSVTITGVSLDELSIETQVVAQGNSAFEGPYAGLVAKATDSTIIDMGGGISGTTKLIAGQTYTFTGKVFNLSNANDKFAKLLFEENIKQW